MLEPPWPWRPRHPFVGRQIDCATSTARSVATTPVDCNAVASCTGRPREGHPGSKTFIVSMKWEKAVWNTAGERLGLTFKFLQCAAILISCSRPPKRVSMSRPCKHVLLVTSTWLTTEECGRQAPSTVLALHRGWLVIVSCCEYVSAVCYRIAAAWQYSLYS